MVLLGGCAICCTVYLVGLPPGGHAVRSVGTAELWNCGCVPTPRSCTPIAFNLYQPFTYVHHAFAAPPCSPALTLHSSRQCPVHLLQSPASSLVPLFTLSFYPPFPKPHHYLVSAGLPAPSLTWAQAAQGAGRPVGGTGTCPTPSRRTCLTGSTRSWHATLTEIRSRS